jgi:glucose-6-phosphate 1-dehydrogenase
VTGDLTKRLLMPALVNMTAQGLAGDDLSVLGIADTEADDESLRAILQDFREHGDSSDYSASDKSWASLKSRIGYLRGGFDEPDTYARLAERLNRSGDTNVVFYLATALASLEASSRGSRRSAFWTREMDFAGSR